MTTNKLFLHSVGVMALLATCASAPVTAQNNFLAREEQRLLTEFRAKPSANTLERLALVREEAGLFDRAEASWKALASRYGGQETIYFDETKPLTYAQLAAWMQHRLRRKRNLARNGKATNQQFRRAYYARTKTVDDAATDATRNIDLDGDGIDEVITMDYHQGTDTPRWVSIYKWDNLGSYRPVFSTLQNWKNPVKMEYGDYEADEMRDGFAEITMILQQRPTIEGYILLFNGRTFIGKHYGA